VTSGVVSGYPTHEGRRYIQTDAIGCVPPRDPLPPHCPDVPPGSEHLPEPSARPAPDAAGAIPGAPGASDVLDGLSLEPPAEAGAREIEETADAARPPEAAAPGSR
jgi:hypothetical protein